MSANLSWVLLGIAYILGASALLVSVFWLYRISSWRWLTLSSSSLSHLPEVKYEDENNSAERYNRHMKPLIHEGYMKYLKHGQAFKTRNLHEEQLQVILPQKYLEELKSAPNDCLSFRLWFENNLSYPHSGGPTITDVTIPVIEKDLTRNIGRLLDHIHTECSTTLKEIVPNEDEWTFIKSYALFASVTAEVISSVFIAELGKNKEWISLITELTPRFISTAKELREVYSSRWNWLAPWFHTGTKAVWATRKNIPRLLSPIYTERLARQISPKDPAYEQPNDALQWLLNAHKKQTGTDMTLEGMTNEQLFLAIVSIHTTMCTAINTVYDLLAYPKYIEELRTEIEQVWVQHGQWTKKSLAQLTKLECFMKESQRINPIGLVSLRRVTAKPYTFKDGLHIPGGTTVSIPSYDIANDPDYFPNPETFSPYRYLNMNETLPHRYNFTSISDDFLAFGGGAHACPGRFLAAYEIKIMIIELLTHFEMKFPEEQKGRPESTFDNMSIVPNTKVMFLIKRRGGAER